MVEQLLYGCNKFKFQQNYSIFKSSIKFTIKSERYCGSLIQENIAHTFTFCLSVCILICSLNLKIYIKLPQTIPKQSGVYLGLVDQNQFLHFFCFNNLTCLVFHIVFLVIFLSVMCKSFDRTKKKKKKEKKKEKKDCQKSPQRHSG